MEQIPKSESIALPQNCSNIEDSVCESISLKTQNSLDTATVTPEQLQFSYELRKEECPKKVDLQPVTNSVSCPRQHAQSQQSTPEIYAGRETMSSDEFELLDNCKCNNYCLSQYYHDHTCMHTHTHTHTHKILHTYYYTKTIASLPAVPNQPQQSVNKSSAIPASPQVSHSKVVHW